MSLLRPGNVLTVCLAAATVVAAGGVGALFLARGGEPNLADYVAIPPPAPEANVKDIVLDPPPQAYYAEIGDRPLFNDDRRPKPPEEDEQLAGEDCENPDDPNCVIGDEVVVEDLNVRLTGVILTPEKQFVMFTDRETKEAMTAAVGEPIEGRLAGWRLDAVNARDAVFVEELNGRQATVELETHKQTLGGSNVGAERSVQPTNGQDTVEAARQAAAQGDGQTQADEVRRRIAERRARMRAEAARKQAEMREQQEQENDKDG